MKSEQKIMNAVLLILALLICFVGCSSDSPNGTLSSVASQTDNKLSVSDSGTQNTVDATVSAPTNGPSQSRTAPFTSDSNQSTQRTDATASGPAEKPYEYEKEPAVPIRKIDLNQAIKGIDGHEVVRFFKTISTMPVLYHYNTTDVATNHTREAIIALADQGRSYVHLIDGSQSVEIVSPEKDKYYELNDKDKTATAISKQDAQGDMISQDSFEQLYTHANELYFVGEGEAVFKGKETKFEEYTKDNRTFIRYYFANDMVYGHRTFENGTLTTEVAISTLKNYFEMDIFAIPQGYQTVESQN